MGRQEAGRRGRGPDRGGPGVGRSRRASPSWSTCRSASSWNGAPFLDHEGLEVLVDGKTDYSFVSATRLRLPWGVPGQPGLGMIGLAFGVLGGSSGSTWRALPDGRRGRARARHGGGVAALAARHGAVDPVDAVGRAGAGGRGDRRPATTGTRGEARSWRRGGGTWRRRPRGAPPPVPNVGHGARIGRWGDPRVCTRGSPHRVFPALGAGEAPGSSRGAAPAATAAGEAERSQFGGGDPVLRGVLLGVLLFHLTTVPPGRGCAARPVTRSVTGFAYRSLALKGIARGRT
ncbi:hypothetical protein SHIRM173S_10935 [Streptomyces hirsutus]